MAGLLSSRATLHSLLPALCAGFALACSAAPDSPSPVALGGAPSALGGASGGGASGSGASGGAAGGSAYRAPSPQCRAPAGVSNSPQSIAETMTLLNALPKPLTIQCFLESLARPLPLVATAGVLSAQPAGGARSPRMFLFFGPNRMSIVPVGDGSNLLEFGEVRPDNRSLKAEIQFPVTADIPASEPFERVMYNADISSCAFCHAAEGAEPNLATMHAFVSQSLRPSPRNAVSLEFVRSQYSTCDATAEPFRCAMYDSLFSLGPVVEGQFPLDMPTFE